MSFHYENFLRTKLLQLQSEMEISDFDIIVEEEQMFVKHKSLAPKTIYVITKYLASSIEYFANTQPINILILTEQNGLDVSKALFTRFADTYNWNVITEGTEYIKQQYSSPVVLSNFNEVTYGYRSVMYMSSTLYIMENVADVKNVTIDGNAVKPLTFNVSYTMTPNTQQLASEYISSSVKSVSGFSIAMSVPMIDSALVTKLINILDENNSGNDNFVITFDVGDETMSKTMKLTSAQVVTAPNQVPSLQLGFIK